MIATRGATSSPWLQDLGSTWWLAKVAHLNKALPGRSRANDEALLADYVRRHAAQPDSPDKTEVDEDPHSNIKKLA